MMMMIETGEKISPIEVDAVLLSHPDIAQAVAFGVPDVKYGEEVYPLFIPLFIIYVQLLISLFAFINTL